MNFENVIQQIDQEISNLIKAKQLLSGEQIEVPSTLSESATGLMIHVPEEKKSRFSPLARKRMRAAQKLRWKKYREGKLASHSRKLAWRKESEVVAPKKAKIFKMRKANKLRRSA